MPPKYTSRQQLISTRTIANIARQVHQEEIDKLIKRNFLFGEYNPSLNLWTNLAFPPQIGWAGAVVCLSNFRQVDNQTVPNLAVLNDPSTMINETTQALQDGANVVAPIVPIQTGRRTGDIILVHGVSAVLRLRAVRNGDSNYMEHVKFKYGFYTWRKITAQGFIDNTIEPDCRALIKWKPQGYSSSLDNLQELINYQGIPYATENLNMQMNSEVSHSLCTGSTTLRYSNFNGIVNLKTVRLYKKFKTPIEIQFKPGDNQTGQKVLNKKLYFAIQTDAPDDVDIEHLYQPFAQVITKLYYTNKD